MMPKRKRLVLPKKFRNGSATAAQSFVKGLTNSQIEHLLTKVQKYSKGIPMGNHIPYENLFQMAYAEIMKREENGTWKTTPPKKQ